MAPAPSGRGAGGRAAGVAAATPLAATRWRTTSSCSRRCSRSAGGSGRSSCCGTSRTSANSRSRTSWASAWARSRVRPIGGWSGCARPSAASSRCWKVGRDERRRAADPDGDDRPGRPGRPGRPPGPAGPVRRGATPCGAGPPVGAGGRGGRRRRRGAPRPPRPGALATPERDRSRGPRAQGRPVGRRCERGAGACAHGDHVRGVRSARGGDLRAGRWSGGSHPGPDLPRRHHVVRPAPQQRRDPADGGVRRGVYPEAGGRGPGNRLPAGPRREGRLLPTAVPGQRHRRGVGAERQVRPPRPPRRRHGRASGSETGGTSCCGQQQLVRRRRVVAGRHAAGDARRRRHSGHRPRRAGGHPVPEAVRRERGAVLVAGRHPDPAVRPGGGPLRRPHPHQRRGDVARRQPHHDGPGRLGRVADRVACRHAGRPAARHDRQRRSAASGSGSGSMSATERSTPSAGQARSREPKPDRPAEFRRPRRGGCPRGRPAPARARAARGTARCR